MLLGVVRVLSWDGRLLIGQVDWVLSRSCCHYSVGVLPGPATRTNFDGQTIAPHTMLAVPCS
jgi:hypothetical protein